MTKENVMSAAKQTVIIAGGGYAGVLAANRVQGRLGERARVLLVTPDEALTERIRLHQLAASGTDITQPYARLLAPGIERLAARALDVRPSDNTLIIDDGEGARAVRYDALILSLGSTLTARVPAASLLSAALTGVAQARELSRALARCEPGARVQVVGGGLTAIELSAELAEAHPRLQVELLAQRVAGDLEGPARDVLIEELQQLGVSLREGLTVARASERGAVLQDGTLLPAAITVLASGFEPAPLMAAAALARGADGRVLVDAELRVRGTENVFAAGDFAAPPKECVGSGVRSTRMGCVNAMPLGAHAADQVARLLTHQPLRPFHTAYMIQCISIGRRRGVVVFVDRDDRPTGRVIRGRVGAMIKEMICRFVIGGMRLERRVAGVYAWPEMHRSAMLPKAPELMS
jgi:NADH dehydrogenase FAD-containing subunit